jgi:hypothetical protein
MYLATLDCATSNPSLSSSAVDAWRAPQRVLDAHPPDQSAQLHADLRPSSQPAGLQTPIVTKPGLMPAHERLGTDHGDDPEHRRKPSIQLDKDQAIGVAEADTPCHLSPQHNQLISERRILCFKPALRL